MPKDKGAVVFKIVAIRLGWPALVNGEIGTSWTKWMSQEEAREMALDNSVTPEREFLAKCPICGREIVQPDAWFSKWYLEEHLMNAHNIGYRDENEYVGLIPRPKWVGPKIVME